MARLSYPYELHGDPASRVRPSIPKHLYGIPANGFVRCDKGHPQLNRFTDQQTIEKIAMNRREFGEHDISTDN